MSPDLTTWNWHAIGQDIANWFVIPLILFIWRKASVYLKKEFAKTVASNILQDEAFAHRLAAMVVKQINGTYITRAQQESVNERFRENFTRLDQGQRRIEADIAVLTEELSRMHKENTVRLDRINNKEAR